MADSFVVCIPLWFATCISAGRAAVKCGVPMRCKAASNVVNGKKGNGKNGNGNYGNGKKGNGKKGNR